jgi:ankyrin repeat protein
MLQCLLVAVRPLRVEELAEVLAFEFDATHGGIPKYRAAWRLDDQTQAVLSTCSSLVTVVGTTVVAVRVVQFSHFSVKEFLMSNRLGDFSRYHIHPLSAHTVLTQACLGVLLHFDDNSDKKCVQGLPLAKYAAQHWVEHAQFQGVASRVKDGMETLFDSDKPHFAAWVGIYDVDNPYGARQSSQEIPNPLYYSARCGFYDLVKHLAVKCPEHVNAICGRYRLPLFAALEQDHVEIVELLLEHGANVDARETTGETMLLKVLSRPQHNLVEIVTLLLKHGADVNARDTTFKSSLHLAECRGELKVAQMLLDHKPDVNSQDNNGRTPLHVLLECRTNDEGNVLNHTLLLLGLGADVNRRDKDNVTPLHLAIRRGWFKFARILLERGADATANNNTGKTPLHILSESRTDDEGNVLDHALLLLELGADVNRRDKNNETPLHLAIRRGWFKFARILLEHGADATADNNTGKTPLHILSGSRTNDEGDVLNHALLLLELGADVNRRDKSNETPLHLAIRRGWFKFARILLEHGADTTVDNNIGKTPLHILSESRTDDEGNVLDHALLLLKLGADVNKQDKQKETPLHLAIRRAWFGVARILLDNGADAIAENKNCRTPLHVLSEREICDEGSVCEVLKLLIEYAACQYYYVPWSQKSCISVTRLSPRLSLEPERGVGINVQAEHHMALSNLESNFGLVQMVEALLERGANINAGGETSICQELEGEYHFQ